MAKKEKYSWDIGSSLPIIEEHSLVKLEIIEKYLEAYIRHLTILPVTNKLKFAIVDGFSGGGLYESLEGQEILGSPLRIIETIERLKKVITFERENNKFRQIDFDIPVYCIEKNTATFKFLQRTLSQRGLNHLAQIINGEFEKVYTNIIKELQNKKYQKAIFLLDQYGYVEASINSIKYILKSFKKAEIILTFACDNLIDYLSIKNKTALLNLGLDNCDIEHLLDTKQDNDDNRKILQFILLKSIINKVGACYYTPFFIQGKKTHRAYWLLHFSNHPTARNEMVKLHYENYNSFIHYGGKGLDMFGYSTQDKYTLKPFLFTEEDKIKGLELIKKQIQSKVKKYDNQTFDTLIQNEINNTPATIETIQESLKEQLYYGDIEIINPKTNKKIKKYTDIKLKYIIKDTKQQRFEF